MSEVTEPVVSIDGRVARRERNIALVLDTVIEMFGEDAVMPTIERVAERAGLSARSLYRYFADPDALIEAAFAAQRRRSLALADIDGIGEGSLDRRLDAFVASRWRVYEANRAIYRAAVHHSMRHPRFAEGLVRRRDEMREQLELQFAPELDAMGVDERAEVAAAADALTQLDALDLLARHRGLSEAAVSAVLRRGLAALLA
ncbi:MAG: helix-turn-helix domain-containing protein [Actinomycetota bacterium]